MSVTRSTQQFLNDYKEGQVKDMHNLNCSSCNDCCTCGVAISEEEYKTIIKFLKTTKQGKEIHKAAMKKIKDHLEQGTIYWLCPFSNSKKRCSIYNIRPKICKEFHCDKELYAKYELKYDKLHEGKHYILADIFYEDWRSYFVNSMKEME